MYNIWQSKETFKFDEIIKWLLLYGSDNILEEILKCEELLKDESLSDYLMSYYVTSSDILKITKRNKIEKILLTIYESKRTFQLDKNIEWLLLYGSDSTFNKIIAHEQFLKDENLGNHIENKNFSNDYKKNKKEEFLFTIWQSKEIFEFDETLKWLLLNGSDNVLEEILKCEELLKDENLSNYVRSGNFSTVFEKNKKEKILFAIWQSKEAYEFDEAVKWLLSYGSENVLNKILKCKELLKDEKFDNYVRSSDFSRNHKKIKNENFLFAIWQSKEIFEFDEMVKWLLDKGSVEILEKLILINIENWVKDKKFIDYILNKNYSETGETIKEKFLLGVCESKEEVIFDETVKWLLDNGSTPILEKLILINKENWVKNNIFVDYVLKKDYYSCPHYYSDIHIQCYYYDYYGSAKKQAIQEFFLIDVCESKEEIIFDEIVKWLLNKGSAQILEKLIMLNKENWIKDEVFIDYILNMYYYDDTKLTIKEDFLLSVYKSNSRVLIETIEKWFCEESSFEGFKKFVSFRLSYSVNILAQIYASFYPKNDIKYFEKKDCSSEFIRDRNNEMIQSFRKLFIDELTLLKNGAIQKKKVIKKETHAATDLASFAFCPASYAINQMYYIDISEEENVFVGTKEHEKQRLLGFNDRNAIVEKRNTIRTPIDADFRRILWAECLSQGHGNTQATVYYSPHKKIVGVPDYIFRDKDGNFAVEEKYTFKKYENITALYLNHKIQALAYLYGLAEWKFNEVYVIYWFMEKKSNDDIEVCGYRLFKVTKNETNKQQILNVFNQVEALQNDISYNFTANQINYNKCTKCNYFPYCEYKKGDIPMIKLY